MEATAVEATAVEAMEAADEHDESCTPNSPAPKGDKSRKAKNLSPLENRVRSGEEVRTRLRLELVDTSGYRNNCLSFSVMMGGSLGKMSLRQQEQRMIKFQSDEQRQLSHKLLLKALPAEAKERKGTNMEWWCGHDHKSVVDIFNQRNFMNEMHVHAFCNRMNRAAIVLDERGAHVAIIHYKLGFVTQKQISMRAALQIRNDPLQKPMWLNLTQGHWEALLPK